MIQLGYIFHSIKMVMDVSIHVEGWKPVKLYTDEDNIFIIFSFNKKDRPL
jgi:hypothetical protein